jgi:diguanylate cyclase (GGDEF)-like protein/PAS domain S-box-containing protein
MDSEREDAFDRLTRLASRLLGVPVSLVSLVDDRRQYFKSAVGLELRETPLSHSFCQHVVLAQRPLIVTDARDDPLVSDNLAVRDLDMIAYAGVPLTIADGQTLGSFCAIDSTPRTWSEEDIALLEALARGVIAEIELRASNRELERCALELRDAEQTARRERDYSNAIIASMREGFLLTRDGVILEVNDALCEMTGFGRDELIAARAPYPFWAPEAANEIQAHRRALSRGPPRELRTTYQHKNGTPFRVSINTVAARAGDTAPIGYVSTIRDITDQERREARLEYDASRDSLTGLLNRRVFDRHLDAEIARATRYQRSLSIALLDLDHFKQINDRHGHPVGDQVLQETSRRLARMVREGEYIARIGGEEFGWILPDATAAGAHAAAERAREAISDTPFAPAGRVTLSAGVCQLAADSNDPPSLYRNADQALYRAKRQGGNRTIEHKPPKSPANR